MMENPTANRLNFGPRHGFDRPSGKIIRLTLQLAFVLALFHQISKPQVWESIFGNHNPGSVQAPTPGTALIDPELPPPALPAGMFLAAQNPEKIKENINQFKDEPKTEILNGVDQDSPGPIRTPLEDLPFLLETTTDLDRDLPPALYYHFLDKARNAKVDQLIADSRQDVTFSHLYQDPRQDPKKYRGQLLQITGTVRRALSFDVPPNAYGLKKRYELWIFTEDSGKFPWVVELSELPPGFPIGSTIQEKVVTAGYFLKLWAYRAQDGFRSAPVLLGHGLNWQRTELIRARFERKFAWAMGLFLGIFLLVLIYRLFSWRNDDRLLKQHKSISSLTDRMADLPDKLDLSSGVFPEPQFDYIGEKNGSKSVQINQNDEHGGSAGHNI